MCADESWWSEGVQRGHDGVVRLRGMNVQENLWFSRRPHLPAHPYKPFFQMVTALHSIEVGRSNSFGPKDGN